MSAEREVIEEAELITAAVGQFQERNPGAQVAKVEIYDLKAMESRGRRCLDCGAAIAVCFWIQKCDPCLDAMKENPNRKES